MKTHPENDEHADALTQALRKLDAARAIGHARNVAEALEAVATQQLENGDPTAASTALEQAAAQWGKLGEIERQGNCSLLSACGWRLAGDLNAAARVLSAVPALLPVRLQHAIQLERCEQLLAAGKPVEAEASMDGLIESLHDEEASSRAILLQRRAAARLANADVMGAADDFMAAAQCLEKLGATMDAEAAVLAAAAALANGDTVMAERRFAAVCTKVPRDGAAAARRGLVGGHIAIAAGNAALAVQRFDMARQGALDIGDPVSYLAATLAAAHAAETIPDIDGAYARLATAWTTLGDKLGRQAAAQALRPELAGLRERVGAPAFTAAKQAYEAKQRGCEALGGRP